MAEVKIWYDREGDFLEIVFADAPAYPEEIEDDIFERARRRGRLSALR